MVKKNKNLEKLIRKYSINNPLPNDEMTKKATEYAKQGEANYEKGDYIGAIKFFDRAIEIQPKYVSAYVNRIRAKEKLYNYKSAIMDYDKLIRIAIRKSSFLFLHRGYAKAALNNYRGAIQDYDKAIEVEPKNASIYLVRGYVKELIGDFRGEIKDCNKAIKINSKYAFAYINRGRAKSFLDNQKGAIQDYSIGISLEPENKYAYDYRGAAKRELGDYINATKDFDTAIKLDPGFLSAFNNRGFTKFISGDINGAIQDYRYIIKKYSHKEDLSAEEKLEMILQLLTTYNRNIGETLPINLDNAQYTLTIDYKKPMIKIGNREIKLLAMEFSLYCVIAEFTKAKQEFICANKTVPLELLTRALEVHSQAYPGLDGYRRRRNTQWQKKETIGFDEWLQYVSKINFKIKKSGLAPESVKMFLITPTGPKGSKSYSLPAPPEKIQIIR